MFGGGVGEEAVMWGRRMWERSLVTGMDMENFLWLSMVVHVASDAPLTAFCLFCKIPLGRIVDGIIYGYK